MTAKSGLTLLFGGIFTTLLAWTVWATLHQSVTSWGGLTTPPDHYWTIATLLDAYFGFITFYVWVAFKERRWLPRVSWFVAIMLLGNMAMSLYVLIQLWRLPSGQPVASILSTHNA